MRTCYKQEGLTHYFVVFPDDRVFSGYESRLLESGRMPGFLPLEIRELNGRQALYYRMDFRVPVREASEHLKASYTKLKRMTGDIIAAVGTAEAYLLEPERILWRADAVFMDTESGGLQFCYMPEGERETRATGEDPGTGERRCGYEPSGGGKPCAAGLPELMQQLAAEILLMADRRDAEGVQWSRRFYDLLTGDCSLEKLVCFQHGESHRNQRMELVAEPEEPYVVSKTTVQNAREDSRLEKPVRYGIAASAVWSGVVLLGLLAGILQESWINALMGGLAVLILLSVCSMMLYKEDSPEEIMKDYFSGELPDRYMQQDREIRTDRYMEGKGEIPPDRYAEQAGEMRPDGFLGSPAGQKGYVKGGTASHAGSGQAMEMDEASGQTVLLRNEEPGQEEDAFLWLQPAEPGKHADIYLCRKAAVLGSLEEACDYVLRERGVSRMHAKLLRRENRLYLTDLNSTNGTYINGERMESGKEYPLEEGDSVVFARCEFVVAEGNRRKLEENISP